MRNATTVLVYANIKYSYRSVDRMKIFDVNWVGTEIISIHIKHFHSQFERLQWTLLGSLILIFSKPWTILFVSLHSLQYSITSLLILFLSSATRRSPTKHNAMTRNSWQVIKPTHPMVVSMSAYQMKRLRRANADQLATLVRLVHWQNCPYFPCDSFRHFNSPRILSTFWW